LLVDFVWTDELLDEWERVIVREGKRTPDAARSVSAAVRRFFATTRIDPASYRHRVSEVPGLHPADRVHTAACAFGGAMVLLTRNRRDFPEDFLAEHGVTVTSADEYLTALLRRRPAAFLDVVARLASEKHQPPVTPGLWTRRDNSCGLVTFWPALRSPSRCRRGGGWSRDRASRWRSARHRSRRSPDCDEEQTAG